MALRRHGLNPHVITEKRRPPSGAGAYLAQTTQLPVVKQEAVVEGTFDWLMRHRPLVRDYETSTASAEAFVLLAMIRIQIRRLA